MESFRKNDMKAETQLGVFLDRCFYSKLHDTKGNNVFFERKKDAQSQLQGIDIELVADGKRFLIDEKASIYYSNLMIPTFAFEIDSLQRGHSKPVEGWFINDELLTEYYLLIWPNIKCESINNKWLRKDLGSIRDTDFTIVEAMLVEKERLVAAVNNYGCDKPHLLTYAKMLRKKANNISETITENINENIKIMYSGKIAEKPINVVIRKSMLKEIASATYLISEDGYAQI